MSPQERSDAVAMATTCVTSLLPPAQRPDLDATEALVIRLADYIVTGRHIDQAPTP
ncbi:hypothetical protein [Kocuria sp.]|uniref:hypothetical protein n=1 Tax=Kocuria sp. TaxID=1871328 RepID=UPI0026E090FD|nr:hypothetical protein [Kocuria sp.]MDO5618031.1 hypothetical protein [Kocuria sp.]